MKNENYFFVSIFDFARFLEKVPLKDMLIKF